MVYLGIIKRERQMTFITEDMHDFMKELWGAEGDFIDTPLGRGRIENVRCKFSGAGPLHCLDLEVMVKIPDLDGFTLFNGMELFDMEEGRA